MISVRMIHHARLALAGVALAALATAPALADIKVGMTISASGPGAALGQPQMKSVAVMPKEIGGEKIIYVPLDDESDGTKSALNMRKLITEEKADVVIGSSLTPTSLPLIDIAFETKTPLITIAASTSLVEPMDDKRKWVFKVVPNDSIMAKAMIDWIAKKGIKRLGYLGFSDAYGEGYWAELAKAAPALGIELTTHEVYARNDTSVAGQVLKIIATKPDAVFIAAAGTPAVLPQKALRERGYTGLTIQTHGIGTQEFIRLGGKEAEGVVFTGEAFIVANDLPDSDPFKKVPAAYIKAYEAANGTPPNVFGGHIRDCVALLEDAIPRALKKAKSGTPEFRAALRDELENVKGLYLNNGLSTMSPTDHNGYDARSALLIKVEGGQFRLMK